MGAFDFKGVQSEVKNAIGVKVESANKSLDVLNQEVFVGFFRLGFVVNDGAQFNEKLRESLKYSRLNNSNIKYILTQND